MSRSVLHFLGFSLDPANAQLRRDKEVIALRPKTLAVLHHLAAHAGRLVTKAELLDTVWPDTAVGEWVLTSCIKELRRALEDDPRRPRAVETAHRHGYRFIAEVRVSEAPASGDRSAAVRTDLRTALQSDPRHLTPSLMGRASDLAQLDDCLRRACTGERQIVFVVGEPGIGKTALVDAFLRTFVGADQHGDRPTAPATTCLVAHGQCIEQHGAGEPYLPVLEALGRLCTAADGERFIDVLRRHAPAWLVQLPGVLDSAEAETLERRLGTTTQARMLRELASAVAALPAPLILVLEDLHWSDHATIDLLSVLAQRRDAARLFVIGTYRPVDVVVRDHPLKTVHQELRAHGRCRDVWVQPLSVGDVSAYCAARWPGIDANEALVRAVHQRTDGNPLFLVSMADYLVTEGVVAEIDGRWRLCSEVPTLTDVVPVGLRQLLAMQIDRLSEPDCVLLEAGSVIGRTFSAALVAAAIDAEVVGVERQLAKLAQTGQFVRAAGVSEWPDSTIAGNFELTHDMYRRVLHDRVPPARARQLHARTAARLERGYRDRTADISAELAYHFDLSGEPDRAVQYLQDAATRALRRGAAREAIELLNRGLTLLDGLPTTPERTLNTIRVLIALGGASPALHGLGHPIAEQAYLRARALSEETGDQVQLFQVIGPLSATYVAQARPVEALEMADAVTRLMEAMPLPAFLFAGNVLLGIVQYHCGELDLARKHLQQAIDIGEVPLPALSGDLYVHALCHSGLTLLHFGLPDQALAMIDRAAARAAVSGRPFDRAIVLQVSCFLLGMLSDMPSLRRIADEAIVLGTEHGYAALRAIGTASRGRSIAAHGDCDAGIADIADGIAAYRSSGQRVALTSMIGWQVAAHLRKREAAAAEPLLADVFRLAAETQDRRSIVELHRLHGEYHEQLGNQSAALDCFQRAVRLAREQEARWWELRALSDLARIRHRDRREAVTELAALVASFSEGHDTVDMRHAQSVLQAAR